MSRPGQRSQQPRSPYCSGRGEVSGRGSRPEPFQPRPHPAQVTRHGISLTISPGIPEMLDQVIPHVPVTITQLPPRDPRRVSPRGCPGQPGRCRVHQDAGQIGQPLPPELGAQEITDHVMQCDTAIRTT